MMIDLHPFAFSASTLCWSGGRNGIRPVKNRVVGCWRGYLSVRGADLHMAQLMPLPLTVSCFSKIQIGLPFWYRLTRIVLDKEPLNGCVCVCVYLHPQSLNLPSRVHPVTTGCNAKPACSSPGYPPSHQDRPLPLRNNCFNLAPSYRPLICY